MQESVRKRMQENVHNIRLSFHGKVVREYNGFLIWIRLITTIYRTRHHSQSAFLDITVMENAVKK